MTFQKTQLRAAKCPACGSASVYISDVSAYWDHEAQDWRVSDFDDADVHCSDCELTHGLGDVLRPTVET